MATYKEIIDYINRKYGIKIYHPCYIADAKGIFGINSINYTRKIKCPSDLIPIIGEAFVHFGMIENNTYKKPFQNMKICDFEFEYIGQLIPEKNIDGTLYSESFVQNSFNSNGQGPFCRFCLPSAKSASGVFMWIDSDRRTILYIGNTIDLSREINRDIGKITLGKCSKKGQSTNCKLNNVALKNFEQNKSIHIYFYPTNKGYETKKEILNVISPLYNGRIS